MITKESSKFERNRLCFVFCLHKSAITKTTTIFPTGSCARSKHQKAKLRPKMERKIIYIKFFLKKYSVPIQVFKVLSEPQQRDVFLQTYNLVMSFLVSYCLHFLSRFCVSVNSGLTELLNEDKTPKGKQKQRKIQ